MTKARTLANFISDNNEFADGTISVSEVSGAAPLASPSFTGNATLYNASGNTTLRIETDADAYASISFLNDQSNWGTGVDTANHFYVYDSINSSNVMEFGNNDIVFNQTGKDYDFRVESDGNTHMLFVDASENAVAIGSASTSTAARLRAAASAVASGDSIVLIDSANDANVAGNHLHITSLRGDTSAYNLLTIDNVAGEILNISGNGSVVFNEAGGDRDFRIESDLTNYSFFVDASSSSGYGHVKISGNTPASGTSTAGGDSTTYTNGLTIENNEASYTNGALALVNKYNWGYGNSIEWHNVYDTSGGTLGITNRITSQWVSANNYKTDFFEMSGGVLRKSLSLNAGQVVVNEDGQDEDFRVESDANANMLFVDSSTNRVHIGDTASYGSTAFQIYQNSASTSDVRGMTIRNASSSASSQAGMLFVNYDNIGAKIYSRRTGSTEGDLRIQINTGGTTAESSLQDAIRVVGSYGGSQAANMFNEGGTNMDFRVESDNVDHMLFVDAGNDRIGINNSTPSSTVHIGRSGASDTGMLIQQANTAPLIKLNGRMNNSGTTTTAILFKDGSTATDVGSVTVTSSGVTYNTTSDRRLKTDIQPIANGTEKLMAMNPVSHKWIADPEAPAVHGFIAQEMQQIVPEAVSGDPDGEEMMSMDYGRITPVLVAALQDAHKKIEALEERLAELETN